ncbi:MAG: 50S ribosomal protein L4 [Vulcanimicrobiaceae bacterium]
MLVIDATGATVREADTPAVFATDASAKRNAIFRAVFRELANPRAGTASTKRRDEVSGGGRKPWRQKGTGRARQGSTRSPQWTHGGVVFGPKPRSYETSLNKKERRAAMHAALCDRFANGCVTLLAVDGFELAKTAQMATLLFGSRKRAVDGQRILIVYAAAERDSAGERIERISRNLPGVGVTHTHALDVKDVVGHARLLLTPAAQDELVAIFGEKSNGSA